MKKAVPAEGDIRDRYPVLGDIGYYKGMRFGTVELYVTLDQWLNNINPNVSGSIQVDGLHPIESATTDIHERFGAEFLKQTRYNFAD